MNDIKTVEAEGYEVTFSKDDSDDDLPYIIAGRGGSATWMSRDGAVQIAYAILRDAQAPAPPDIPQTLPESQIVAAINRLADLEEERNDLLKGRVAETERQIEELLAEREQQKPSLTTVNVASGTATTPTPKFEVGSVIRSGSSKRLGRVVADDGESHAVSVVDLTGLSVGKDNGYARHIATQVPRDEAVEEIIQEAIKKGRDVQFAYRKEALYLAESRIIRPQEIKSYPEGRSVVGWDRDRDAYRVFRLDRIEALPVIK